MKQKWLVYFVIPVLIIVVALMFLFSMSEKYSVYFGGVSMLIFISSYLIVLYFVQQNSSGKLNESKEREQLQKSVHNNFSKVPSGPGKVGDVKPIDLSGNVFEHNIETLKDDMKNIGIEEKKETKE